MTHKAILVRHGKSVWNLEGRFTGWQNVDLALEGEIEAFESGMLLHKSGIKPEVAFVSVLKRATKTLHLVLDAMGLDIPIVKEWRLNERHYGALEGRFHEDVMEEVGEPIYNLWRRGFSERPPAMELESDLHPRYTFGDIESESLPNTECLADVQERVLPFWNECIMERVMGDETPLIVAHGNIFRALLSELFALSEVDTSYLEVPTANPLVLEFNDNREVLKARYLDQGRKMPLPL